MNLRSSLGRMKLLLRVPSKKRDGKWAYDVCTASRWIHVGVWKECPNPRYVFSEVLRVMIDAKKELQVLKGKKHFNTAERKEISAYVQNDSKRIKNIKQRYLKGKSSEFAPDHKISKRPRKVG